MENKKWDKGKSKIGLGLALAYIMAIAITLITPLIGAGGGTETATGIQTIPNICTFTLSNTVFNFNQITGTLGIPSGANTIGTVNALTVTNTGDIQSNILVTGTTWAYLSNSFQVQNTIWSAGNSNIVWNPTNVVGIAATKAQTTNVEYQLNLNNQDTLQLVPAVSLNTNTIWFGAGNPTTALAGPYSQTISVINNC